MTLAMTAQITGQLVSAIFFLAAIEIFQVARRATFTEVWSIDYSFLNLKIVSVIQILFSMISFFWPHPIFYSVLFITQLLVCLRFRGTYNGGSDMMFFVVLTGLIFALSASNEKIQRLGFIYICIHTIFSYFKAGFVKALHSDWRSGQALPAFLERSVYSDVQKFGRWLRSKPKLSVFLCWLTFLFEISVLGILFHPKLAPYYFLLALGFHFLIYFSFGLNRFFWAWVAAWPAVLFSIGLLAGTAH